MVSFSLALLKIISLASLSICETYTEVGCLIELCDKSRPARGCEAGDEKKLEVVAGLKISQLE